MKKTFIKTIVFALMFAFVLSGCSLISGPAKPGKKQTNTGKKQTGQTNDKIPTNIKEQLTAQSQIKKFADLDELQEFLEQGATVSHSYGVGMRGGVANLGMMAGEEMAMDSIAGPQAMMKSEADLGEATGLGGVSDDFSKTNVQVKGVDEADIIKSDGKYVYAVVKKDLYIIDANPAEGAEVLTKIAFKSRPQDIYINGKEGKPANRLIVFGRDDVFYKTDMYKRFKRRGQFTFFKVFDITDKSNPEQLRDLDFEGNYSNSRMIGDYVYFVTNNHNYYYIDGETVLPRIIDNGEVVANKCAGGIRCFMPDIYYFNIPYQSYNFTSVTAINVADNKKDIGGDVYLLAGNQNMYVSQNNIYITYTKHISEYQLEMEVLKEIIYPRLSARNQDKIAKIEVVENYILSPDEKQRKISQILERFSSSLTEEEQDELQDELEEAMEQKYEDISKEMEKTVIHKIAVKKNDLEYKTFGEVTGQILNQFSMDERNGYFRIATTKNRTWSRYDRERRESYNNLYVLDKNLKQVGEVENLAKGERIYSVRFMQDRAYMVTFKQTDPLFVIDLSNPKMPKVLGKLKVPGYSSYLHPYDNDTLIGIGKDATETGRVKGLKLSLFDVSNVNDPREIDTYVMGDRGSDSIALHDHKAFLFSRDKNLLVIPVSTREWFESMPVPLGAEKHSSVRRNFSGAMVFTISKKGFELKGEIDHSDGRTSSRDYWRGYNYYDNTVKRSLYIDDVLYTFSNNYLKMNDLDDLDLVKKLRMTKQKYDDFEIVN